MRNLIIIFVSLGVLAGSASAQGIKPFNLYIGGGLSVPNDELSDLYVMGYHASAAVGISMAPMLQFAPKIEYHSLKIDEDYWLDRAGNIDPAINTVDGGTFKALMIGADLRFRPALLLSPVKPFVFGGAGWANVAVSDFEVSNLDDFLPFTDESENRFFWNVGAGLEFGSGPLAFFIHGRYLSIETEGEASTFIPVTAGIKF